MNLHGFCGINFLISSPDLTHFLVSRLIVHPQKYVGVLFGGLFCFLLSFLALFLLSSFENVI